MKILITGATGYIGGRLLAYLYANFSFKIYATSKKVPRELIDKYPNITFYDIDLLSLGDVFKDICKNIDCIIHLASANEIVSTEDPVFATELNSVASVRLLEAAKKQGVTRFIYLSTAHVYGSPLLGHLDESTKCKPRHPYAITHKVVEDFVLAAHEKGEIEGVVLRLSNSFGAPLFASVNRWTLLLNNIARNIIEQRRIVMKSSGEDYRDFIALADVCCGIRFFIEVTSTSLQDGLFNLGGENTLRVIEMVMELKKRCVPILGYDPKLVLPETSAISGNSINKLHFDIGKIKHAGFKLTQNTNKELDDLLVFCRDNFIREEHRESIS